jgi:dihydroorotase
MQSLRVVVALTVAWPALAQTYDLVLAGGRVIDPGNGIDGVMDLALSGDKIAAVGKDLAGKKVVDVSGMLVTPGLIDLHAHVYGYSGALLPDDTHLVAGTTTVVDAGGAGWRTFDDLRSRIIDRSRTRVLVWLNIVGRGMLGSQVENNVEDMDPKATAEKIQQHRDLIMGIKTAHYGRPGWTALERAVEAGRLAQVPVIVDNNVLTGMERTTREKLLDRLRPGDLHTHSYNDRQIELVDRHTGRVQEYSRQARARGVLFDMGHGAGSFLWPVATQAMKQGFPPDTVSTDLHATSILVGQPDMPNCISKLMALGMTLEEGIRRSTVRPAQAIGRYPELGTLGPGRIADVAVLAMREGVFAFKDAWAKKLLANKKLECVLTVRGGKIVYDAEGVSMPGWKP